MREVWRDIRGYKGLYKVSNKGRIKALERTVKTGYKLMTTRTYPERILKPSKNPNGYRVVTLTKKGKMRYFSVHRIVLKTFKGNPKKLPTVNHKNGIKDDNRLSNLQWMDYSQQQFHSIKLGLRKPRK